MLFLGIDTETGGLNPVKNDLLSIGFVVYDSDIETIIDMTEIKVRGTKLRCHVDALKVNKIDLEEHNKVALSITDTREKIYNLIRHHWGVGEKVTLLGWNVDFDKAFLKTLYYGKALTGDSEHRYFFDKSINHRSVDVQAIMTFMCDAMGRDQIQGLDHALRELGVHVMGERHTALADALATVKLYRAIIREARKSVAWSES